MMSNLPTEEGYIFSDPQFRYAVTEWENGKRNVLLITGLSGSGKSSLARDYAERFEAQHINLDIFECIYLGRDDVSDYFKKMSAPQRKFFKDVLAANPLPKERAAWQKFNSSAISKGEWKQFLDWDKATLNTAIGVALKIKNIKFILDGVQIYSFMDMSKLQDCALIIRGESMATSMKRRGERAKRNPYTKYKGARIIQMLPTYIKWTRELKEFRKEAEKLVGTMTPQEDGTPTTEGFLFNKKVVSYDTDKFGNGKNVLLITGLSGSGKSTQAIKMAESKKASMIGLDIFEYYYWDRVHGKPNPGKTDFEPWDNALKNPNHPISKVIKAHANSKYAEDDRALFKYVADCATQCIKMCLADKGHNYIIEGVQIFCFVPYNLVKQCAVIVRGESVATSAVRKHKRGQEVKDIIGHLKYEAQDDRSLKEFRNEVQSWVTKEKATEATTMAFDTEWAAALELDLLAGGDPTMSRNQRAAAGTTDPGGGGGTEQPQNQPDQNAAPDNPSQDEATPPDDANADAGGTDDADTAGGDDAGTDDMGGDEDMGDEEGGDDGDLGGADATGGAEDPDELKRKINLRKLIVALHSAVASSIEMLQDVQTPEDDDIANRLDKLLSRMRSAEQMLMDLAVDGIRLDPYEDCLRKYSALQQFYQVATATADALFPKDAAEAKAQKA